VDFRQTQERFAAYIRDPAQRPAPDDVEPRRMDMYRSLFFNNIDSFLSSNFPVMRAILTAAQWVALVQDFFSRHACRTPHFSQIAEEFLDFLQYQEPLAVQDYPFLVELAHYEWVEMALGIAQAENTAVNPAFASNPESRGLVLSPLAWPLAYQYPVQQISPDFLPQHPPETPSFLIVYRDQSDDVHFILTNALTFRLLELIEQNPCITAADCLQTLANEVQFQDAAIISQQGLKILADMASKGIIIPANGI
jgi:uncharacterized protein